MQRLKNKVCIVTGAAQGIGEAIAAEYARQGARVVVADIDERRAAEAAKRIEAGPDKVEAPLAIGVDVSNPANVENMVKTTMSRFGRVDVLVNNAALWKSLERRAFFSIPVAEWDQVFAVNSRGPFLCSAAVAPIMKEQGGGKIIFIGSATVWTAQATLTHYVASKAALIGLMRCVARELGPHKIAVNMIHPGITDSGGMDRAYLEVRSKNRLIPRVQVPEDLTGAAVFLASQDSDFITGQQLHVDGGIVMV